MPSGKPIVFISYAHGDEPDAPTAGEVKWLSFVREYIEPAVRNGDLEYWVDRHMTGGAEWDRQIQAKLRECDIFILLVSARSLGSSYIRDTEIRMIRDRQRNHEDVHFYPLILTPTPKAGLELVKDKNIRPRDAKPFSSFSHHDRCQHMSDAADEIAAIADAIAARKAAAGSTSGAPRDVRPPKVVAIGGLPETGYENLVGRDAELAKLDAAWENREVNVFSLVAEGGAGKSALLNEWLTRMRRENYRGAEVVLGWSFYSQGSKERATSSDAFLDWALDQLGEPAKASSATGKGERIAEALTRRRALLALDGVEPLQYGLESADHGKLKDAGLRALLKRFAAEPPASSPGLIVLTSRAEVVDIGKWRQGAAPVERLEKLSNAAGAALLADGGVKGTPREREAASRDFGGHPLALQLLASYLVETRDGDPRKRDHIRGLLANADNPGHDHARRVMESYETEWLAGRPLLLSILSIVGLFDRPASAECVAALLAEPEIPGFPTPIVGVKEDDWSRAVYRLRAARLLSPVDPNDPAALDAHPLAREWFGERLRRASSAAWTAAHGRLYEHLRDSTKEGDAPTLVALTPLYHAIAHGCRAGWYQEALDEVYRNRICRRRADGNVISYSTHILGAHGSNLSALSWFFETPFAAPIAGLAATDRSWVLSEASFALRAQGRLREALPAMRAVLEMDESLAHWRNAAIAASNLSDAELGFGEVSAAVVTGERSVALADRVGDEFRMLVNRTTRANAFVAAGAIRTAEGLFADAEARQAKWRPSEPLLYSVQGYRYCALLLAKGDFAAARERATQAVAIALRYRWVLDIALDTLTLGRAAHGLARTAGPRGQARAAAGFLDQAVEGLRAAGQVDDLPRGLLARAAFLRSLGDIAAAARDLDEVAEIAEPGPMRLFLCDLALERARLALARREGFAPLNGLVDISPPPPSRPAADEAARLLAEARAQVAIASRFVAECGYHQRDGELAELEAVLRGERRFAELPPHV